MLKVTAMAHGPLQAKRNDLADIVVKLLQATAARHSFYLLIMLCCFFDCVKAWLA